jgi:hypothetical protein
MAKKILEKAATFGAALSSEEDDNLRKTAGLGLCSAGEAAQALLSRVEATRKGPGRTSEIQAEMLKLARTCLEDPVNARTSESLVRTAGVLDTFDRQQGLVSKWGVSLESPEDALFGLTYEKAAALSRDHVELATGSLYRLSDLGRLRTADIRDALGDDYADALAADVGGDIDPAKAATVLRTMPRPDAILFDKVAADLGIYPTLKATKSAAQRSLADLRALAAERD